MTIIIKRIIRNKPVTTKGEINKENKAKEQDLQNVFNEKRD